MAAIVAWMDPSARDYWEFWAENPIKGEAIFGRS
jgi:hypothetical protein